MVHAFYSTEIPQQDRLVPKCPYFGKCGGCQLQDRSYARQLVEKEDYLAELFKDFLQRDLIKKIIPSPKIWNYRRRIQLKVSPRGDVGFFEAHSRYVVPITRCVIAEDALNAMLPELRKKALVALQAHRRPSLLEYELTLHGEKDVQVSLGDEERAFLQVNTVANLRLQESLQKVLEQIRPKTVLELFAGSGNLSYALAGAQYEWTSVESNPASLTEASANRPTRALNMQWLSGDVQHVLRKLGRQKKHFDLILLDPPRHGTGEALASMLQLKPSWIVYVSCEPKQLRHDLAAIREKKYQILWLQGVDFFPQTIHLETIALCRL